MGAFVKNAVQKARMDKSVTQEELAQALGVSRQTVIAIERGRYAPSVLLALKIARYFKMPVEELFFIKYEK